jgi:hypothetical protein
LFALALLATAFSVTPVSAALSPGHAAAPAVAAPSPGIIVPIYTYPTDASWAELIQAKVSFPNVAVVAIVNPASGPGKSVNPEFSIGIKALQAVGIVVIGYVATDFGVRPINAVEQDIYAYSLWYHLNGTMFDQMPAAPGFENYYTALDAYADSLGMSLTVGNPGGRIAASYIGILDTLIVYENSGVPNALPTIGLYQGYNRSDFAIISYGVNSSQLSASIADVSSSARYVYFTSATFPNPYLSLPAYLMKEFSLLDVRRR